MFNNTNRNTATASMCDPGAIISSYCCCMIRVPGKYCCALYSSSPHSSSRVPQTIQQLIPVESCTAGTKILA